MSDVILIVYFGCWCEWGLNWFFRVYLFMGVYVCILYVSIVFLYEYVGRCMFSVGFFCFLVLKFVFCIRVFFICEVGLCLEVSVFVCIECIYLIYV